MNAIDGRPIHRHAVQTRPGLDVCTAILGGVLGALTFGGALGCTSSESFSLTLTRVVPEVDPQCGAPIDGRTLVITGLGDFPAADVTTVSRRIDASGPLTIDSFPASTRVIRIEVLGDAGAIRAMGKTAPFDLEALEDGASLPVITAPPRGVCGTGPLVHPRLRPLLARVATSASGPTSAEIVIIAGGLGGPDGRTPVIPIERYNPLTSRSTIDQAEHYGTGEHGLVGASLTALLPADPDADAGTGGSSGVRATAGTTVLLAGGGVPAFQIYDGPTDSWSSQLFLAPGRGHHAAVALDHRRVLLAGGCAPFNEDHECDVSTADLSTSIVDVVARTASLGPRLLRPRIGGTAIRESAASVLLIGGVDDQGAPVTDIERVFLDGRTGALIAGDSAGSAVFLVSGSALFGFAPTGLPGAARLGLLPASGRNATTLSAPPWALSGVTMTGLQDGRVLVTGDRDNAGTNATVAAIYEPNRSAFVALDVPQARLPGAEHSALALADGTVLLVGGRPAGNPTGPAQPSAWIVRPDLTGPYTSDLFIPLADPDLAQHLIPRDSTAHALIPASDEIPAHALITAGRDGDAAPAEWAILAGPVFSQAQVSARVRVLSGGVALLFGFRADDRYLAAVFNPGQSATVYELASGAPRVVPGCQSQVIEPAQLTPVLPSATAEITLSFSRADITAAIDGQDALHCSGSVDSRAPDALVGQVGVGVTGAAGAQLRLDLFTAER